MENGKIFGLDKRTFTWLVAICVMLVSIGLCCNACKHSIACTVNAKRNCISLDVQLPFHSKAKDNGKANR